jgi:hypothetical protein
MDADRERERELLARNTKEQLIDMLIEERLRRNAKAKRDQEVLRRLYDEAVWMSETLKEMSY